MPQQRDYFEQSLFRRLGVIVVVGGVVLDACVIFIQLLKLI